MDTSLKSLTPAFRNRVVQFLAALVEAKIPVQIISTGRTNQEQIASIKRGTSWTANSRHLTGEAIDVCPFEIYNLHGPDKLNWDAADPVWLKIGDIGKRFGMRWGGDWKQKDMGHFEETYVPIPNYWA